MKGPPRNRLLTASFYMLGFWTLFPQAVVSWMAVEDILSGTLLPSTVVLFSYSIADLFSKSLSPFIVRKISFNVSFCLATSLFVGSLLLLVAIDDIKLRIAGVTVMGIAYGFTRITDVSLLAYYENADILANALENGGTASVFLASIVYTGLTTWLCVAPCFAIAACIPLCLIPLAIYLSLDKEPLKDHLRQTTDHQPIQYAILTDEELSDEQETPEAVPSLSKVLFLFKALPIMGYNFISSTCCHVSVASVLSTLTFPSSPFLPRDHYQYYRLLSDSGMLFGGLLILVVSCFGEKCMEFFRIRKLWSLVTLNVIILLFFVFASWYRFLPNVIFVLVLCFVQGLLHGVTIVYCAQNIASLYSSPRDKGTALSLLQVSFSCSRLAAASLGFFVEPYLREHCTYRLMLGRFCLARHAAHGEWGTNKHCRI
ncbi:protein BTN1-like [Actinia tenebrosa]|uniref:Battenin n=1 Tax=Actinia tenebrosa TaxID=6105 RepID=A0A6P8H867_ACTTE|nr:protein BTN1-like [Actinia tenebrosa]